MSHTPSVIQLVRRPQARATVPVGTDVLVSGLVVKVLAFPLAAPFIKQGCIPYHLPAIVLWIINKSIPNAEGLEVIIGHLDILFSEVSV